MAYVKVCSDSVFVPDHTNTVHKDFLVNHTLAIGKVTYT